jgi:hypothetical protein
MLPVTSLNGITIGDGKVGKIFQSLLDKWSNNVGVDIKNQIQTWNGKSSSTGTTPYQFRSK